jgi:hypothetical protein
VGDDVDAGAWPTTSGAEFDGAAGTGWEPSNSDYDQSRMVTTAAKPNIRCVSEATGGCASHIGRTKQQAS